MTTQKEAEKIVMRIAQEVKARVPEDCQFAMLIFGGEVDEGSYTAFAATASRASVIEAMQEFIGRVGT